MMLLTTILLGGLTVVLNPQATVRGTELTVGEIAEVRGADTELVERVKSLELGWAPAPGYTRTLQRWQIEQKLQSGFPGTALLVEGARVVRVIPLTQKIPGTELRARAEAELRALFGSREAILTPTGQLQDVEIPAGERAPELRCILDKREQRPGVWSIPVQIWVDGTPFSTQWVTYQVEWNELVPILLRDVRRGEILGPEHFELRKARVGHMGGLEPLSGPALLGAVAQLDLPAGSTVTSRDVQRARLVKSGDTVQVQVRKGAITARTAAIAKADGMSGDRIKLTSVDKSRELSGVVIGRGLVEVELGSSGN